AEQRLKKRFAEFNVWRSIADDPVEMSPLGLVDSQSIAPRDLAVCDLVYTDRTGEIYQGVYNPDHRWYYFPKMTRNEAIIIKNYDSMKDGRARFSLHSAFEDPTSPPNPKPRQSIEVRALAFFS
ncbi:MAG TPA: CmcJ/NvfI family oxidoreductase, partial [Reyranellaceae bacterium]|nr:CmcJ/NvfI family oxidoreductase [Reyranellaceae bacterium]